MSKCESISRMIAILYEAQQKNKPISLMPIGIYIIVCDGCNPIVRFKCSNSIEASRVAEIIQEAYDNRKIPSHPLAS